MKQKLSLLVNLLLFAAVIQAAPVSKTEAQKKAQQFISGKIAAARGTSTPSLQLATTDGDNYYVFNVTGQQGFVIVSGDDRAPEILGYSDEGQFDAANIPSNMKAWLQGYTDEIQELKNTPEVAGARSAAIRKAATRTSISPLLNTLWDQHAPFNNYLEGNLTGCVATAMAQVMYYHKCPQDAISGIPSYTLEFDNAPSKTYNSLPATTFDWDNMKNVYSGAESEDANNAVANLMKYCGHSVEMDYGTSGSSAATENVPIALVKYFDYDAAAKYVYRSEYSYSEWIALLYTELLNKRPVVMGGQSSGGGHAFVCDGYDEEDFFHINWGWSGSSNGYYRLSMLTPSSQGAGGSSSSDGYNMSVGATIGVQPDKGSPAASDLLTIRNLKIYNNDAVSVEYTRSNSNSNFTDVTLTGHFGNYTASDNTYQYGVRLKKGGKTVKDFIWSNGISIERNHAKIPWSSTWFGQGLEDGTYQIVAICKLASGEEWGECLDADKYYINAVIAGNKLTLDVVKPTNANLTVTDITGTESMSMGQSQEVSVHLTNNGEGDYHGDISLGLLFTYQGQLTIEKLSGTSVDVKAGESKIVKLMIKPSYAGSLSLTVFDGLFNKGNQLYSEVVTISQTDNTAKNIEIKLIDLENSQGTTVYGNSIKGTIRITNNDNLPYKSGISVTLGKTYNWEQVDDYWTFGYSTVGSTLFDDVIEDDDNREIDFDFKGLEYDERYVLLCKYYYYEGNKNYYRNINLGVFTISHGIVTIDAYGNVEATAPTGNVVIPNGTAVVDLRGLANLPTIDPNDNQNCLYLLDEGKQIPNEIADKNVVQGTTASSITIEDKKDFYSPISFKAQTISYSRQVERTTDGTNGGWMTLVLPFNVDKVTVDGVEKDWFHNSTETGKHFWVKKFVTDEVGGVYFDYTDRIEANTPYIIAVPGSKWGEDWDMTDKTLVFTGTNTLVSSNKSVTSGDNFKFVGTMTSQNLEGIYALDTDGMTFMHSDGDVSILPFQAYFAGSSMVANSSRLAIRSVDGKTTAIGQLPAEIATPDGIYTLDGRKVKGNLPKGVYIVNGKKMIK